MKTLKVPFAYNDKGELIDTSQAEKKVDYKCNCGETVRLRGGDVMRDHFYHSDGAQCSLESVIHKAYKEVFADIKEILMPYPINGITRYKFDRVELERKIGDFIPDAIGYIGETQYLIEFAKTSYIKEKKRDKIKKANLFCIEVAISDEASSLWEIKHHLMKYHWFKNVIHIPMYDEMRELREKFTEAYNDVKRKLKVLEVENHELNQIFGKGVRLYYKRTCKNGSHLYRHNLSTGKELVGFSKERVIDIKVQGETSFEEIYDFDYYT